MTPEQLMESAFREFEQWFIANYPGPETIISDPAWHAPKIFRSATHRLDKAHADALEELDAIEADYEACRTRAERAEAALAESERKCERLKFHAEAMAETLDKWAAIDQCKCSSVDAYRAEFKE